MQLFFICLSQWPGPKLHFLRTGTLPIFIIHLLNECLLSVSVCQCLPLPITVFSACLLNEHMHELENEY